ncbi:MAG: metal ABC transporter ATP-binding protein [Streptosporangiaceae bacterium]
MIEPAAATAAGTMTGADAEVLAVDGVCVRMGGREVLHDVSAAIRRGEFVGLIGSNGAGKTTLLRVILGLQEPVSGQVRVGTGGPRAAGRRPGAGRRSGAGRIGYVPQKILLDPDLPVRARDLVGLGLDGHRLGVPLPSRRRRALVDEMLRAVDAYRFADDRVGNLSGGEQQRVLIAHALISSPDLLLLDEPLANLDIRSEAEIIDLLARIAREQHIAVLMSAHDMNPLLPVMDRLIYLAGGRAASGPIAEVVRPDVLSALYGQHVDVITVHDRILVVAGRGNGHTGISAAGPSGHDLDEDGLHGDGPRGDGPRGDGLRGDGLRGDGLHGDDQYGDGRAGRP